MKGLILNRLVTAKRVVEFIKVWLVSVLKKGISCMQQVVLKFNSNVVHGIKKTQTRNDENELI